MDRRQVCVANVRYHKPGGGKSANNLLRYLTYRESRDEKARHVAGRERWTDYGMGGSVGEIVQRCIEELNARFLDKPFQPGELRQVVRDELNSRPATSVARGADRKSGR